MAVLVSYVVFIFTKELNLTNTDIEGANEGTT